MLKFGFGATAGFLTAAISCSTSVNDPANCTATPDQTLGPFYPDLVKTEGRMLMDSVA